MKKRGAGNVEFILSFILFISFTMAALYFFNPIQNTQNLESSKNYVINVIIENTSVELDTYSIIIHDSSDAQSIEVSLSEIDAGKKVRVVDYYGSTMDSKRDDGQICFKRVNDENFATIYFSEDIDGSEGACGGNPDYKMGSSINSKVISEKRILQLKNAYYKDYSSLKSLFNIPKNLDFSFSFEFPNGEIISAETDVLLRREVFSDTKTKEILREDGTTLFGYLTVKVW
ncbi:MAG TPA: hypothetical protein VI544_02630 [Candidatus Nanoarchaeia archaeon]|nr:hypothetical protein [Candidatus Nanoarchaeia archaeon]